VALTAASSTSATCSISITLKSLVPKSRGTTFHVDNLFVNMAGAYAKKAASEESRWSYLAPVGKGLTVQAGIFASLIGYDSLYAKDNFNSRDRGEPTSPVFDDGRERELSLQR